MKIERATGSDALSIAKVHVASWQAAYKGILSDSLLASLSVTDRAAMWMQIMYEKVAQIWIAKDDDEVVGFVSFGVSRDTNAALGTFEIQAMYADAKHWSTGVGKQLMQTALNQMQTSGAKAVTLWVLEDNVRAIRFYEKTGFVHDGVSKNITLGGATVKEMRLFRMI